ncbi:MAG: hypothetical protein H6561_17030 [Lewinellaceae bacterium]|nr:hypothetical protein [Lewinellaceae bacterium]
MAPLKKNAQFDFPEFGRVLTIDDQGKLWIGTGNSGVFCFDPPVSARSGSFITYSKAQGLLPMDRVASINQDAKGDYWFGSSTIVRFDGASMREYTPEQGIPGSIVSLITRESSGKIWFGGWWNKIGLRVMIRSPMDLAKVLRLTPPRSRIAQRFDPLLCHRPPRSGMV